MKHNIFSLILAISLIAQGCIDEPPGVGEPFNRTDDMAGTWQLSKVTQNDEDAIRKGFPAFVQSLDVTNIFPFNDLTIVLNLDEQGTPASYQVETGNAPNIVGNIDGNWSLDDPDVPSTISFEGGVTLEIENYLGLAEGKMNLKLTRYEEKSDGSKSAFLSYQYEFVKQ